MCIESDKLFSLTGRTPRQHPAPSSHLPSLSLPFQPQCRGTLPVRTEKCNDFRPIDKNPFRRDGISKRLTMSQALIDQFDIVFLQPEMIPLPLQTGQDQETRSCLSIKAMISSGHRLFLDHFLHLTPVANSSFWRVVIAFTIPPRYSASLRAGFGISGMQPSLSNRCPKFVIQAILFLSNTR